MGTSQSGPGPNGGSPLVPPWADNPGLPQNPKLPPQLPPTPKPQPNPQPRRHGPFRRAMGDYIRSGSSSSLRNALRHYSRTSTGGSELAARSLGSATSAGGGLYDALVGGEFIGPDDKVISISFLSGQDCDVVIDVLCNSLTTTDGDSDRIRAAMNHALVEALEGIVLFDPSSITDDIILNTMISYVTECVFLKIVMEIGKDTWSKAASSAQAEKAEVELREFIKVTVDSHMETIFSGNIGSFSTKDIVNAQSDLIKVVWDDWRGI